MPNIGYLIVDQAPPLLRERVEEEALLAHLFRVLEEAGNITSGSGGLRPCLNRLSNDPIYRSTRVD